ncbi:hypothetical protein LPJ73_002569, partial [Coemansia sp. RSA 2703]
MFSKISASAFLFALPILTQLSSVGAWSTVSPTQALFPQISLDTVVAFIPEKNSPPAITAAQANTLVNSVFSPSGYNLAGRYNEYSSGAVKMTGLAGTSDPYATVKYIEQGVDSCDRNTIVNAVYAAIAPANPARLIVIQNNRNPTCSGMSDSSGTVVM